MALHVRGGLAHRHLRGLRGAGVRVPDIQRTFQYHGAEHKTIFCYENDLPLTVENVRKQGRFHPRCGTSFLILMLVIGIIVGFFIPFSNPFLRTFAKLLCIPVIMNVGYEVQKACARHEGGSPGRVIAPRACGCSA